jgi:hypothetical protein
VLWLRLQLVGRVQQAAQRPLQVAVKLKAVVKLVVW